MLKKIKNILIVLIAIIIIFGFYINVEAINSGNGKIQPTYKPEWTIDKDVSGNQKVYIDKENDKLTVVLKGNSFKYEQVNTNVLIDYSSNVTTTLLAEDILVYIDGELDGDVNKNGKLDEGETPSITKTLTQPDPTSNIENATHTLTLSGFEESARKSGKPYKEWSGNISLKILGRGVDSSTYTSDVLVDDTYGNHSMMETDELNGTWIDILLEDEEEKDRITAKDESITDITSTTPVYMFADFIKPEITYVSTDTTVDITNEKVTVIFDVVDKYFSSTTLSNLDASQISVLIDDYPETEINNYLNNNNHKTLTKVRDITYTVNGVENTKIGERYQLEITGLDRNGDGYTYSGYMTLVFESGMITDKSGNTSDQKSITMGKNEPGGSDSNKDIVDVVDPVWELGTVTSDEVAKTISIKLRAIDKYFKETRITTEDILVYVGGVIDGDANGNGVLDAGETSKITKDITSITATNITDTVNGVANKVVGKEHTLVLSNIEPTGSQYETFIPTNLSSLDEETRSTYEYRFRDENGGNITIKIKGNTIEDNTGNISNETEPFDIGIYDFTSPEVYLVRKTQNASANKETIVFNVTDKNYDSTYGVITKDKIKLWIDNIQVDSLMNTATLSSQPIEYGGGTVGHQYTLVISNIAETTERTGKDYLEWSGTLKITIDEDAAKDTKGNYLNTDTTTITDFVDFVKPNIKYEYASGDIDYTGKSFEMTFEITDKYFKESIFANRVEPILKDDTKTDDEMTAAITPIIEEYLTIIVDGDDITNLSTVTKKITEIEDISVTGTLNKTVDGVVKTLNSANDADKEHLVIGKRFTLEISNLQQDLVAVGDEYLDYSGVITVTVPNGFATDTTGNGNVEKIITSGVNIPGGSGTGTVVDVVDPIWEIAGTVTAKPAEQTATLPVKGTDKYIETIGLTESDITITVITPEETVEVNGAEASTKGMTLTITEDTSVTLAYGKKYIVKLDGYSSDAYQVKLTLKEGIIEDEFGNISQETPFVLFSSLVSAASETNANSEFLGTHKSAGQTIPQRQQIEKVIFQDDLDGMNETRWQVSQLKDETIWAWYTDADNNGLYEVHIGSYIIINGNVDSSYLFSYIGYDSGSVETTTANPIIANLELLHVDGVTNMSHMFQYVGYGNMKSFDLGSSFETLNATDMSSMFESFGQTKMTTFSLGDNFKTTSVLNMSSMFKNCGHKLQTFSLGNYFNTSSVTSMSSMFQDFAKTSTTFKSLDLGELFYTTSSVTDMSNMFNGCGQAGMTTLDLGPAFTNIASNNTDFVKDTGITGCIIFAPESIYSSMKSFKLNASATTGTVPYTQGTINPIYRPIWEKVSSTLEDNGEMTIVIKGSANKEFTNGTYTGTYLSNVTRLTNAFTVYVDGEAVNITKNISIGESTVNAATGKTEIQATITLEDFVEAGRRTGKNFREWSGNVSIQLAKGSLVDIYGNQNLAIIDINSAGDTDRIEIEEESLLDKETEDPEDSNQMLMFVDDIDPEYTYEYSTTNPKNPDINTGTETVTVVFDVTDKYFESTALSTDTEGSLITVIVDGNENANTPITKELTRIKDVWYDVTAGINLVAPDATGIGRKVGERYQLVITGLDQANEDGIGDGFSYSGPLTLSFEAGAKDGSGNLTKGIIDKSGNLSEAKTITMGVNEPGGDPDDDIIVDVVDPIWKVENIVTNEGTTPTVTLDLIATDKYYENTIISGNDILVYIDGKLDGDTNNNSAIDAGENPFLEKTLSTATNLTPAGTGIKYTLTIKNWTRNDDSGTVKIVIPAGIADVDGNLTFGIIDETGNLSNRQEFTLGHVDFVKPTITRINKTAEIITQDATNKSETFIINIMDKYLDTTDALTTSEISVKIDNEPVTVDFTNSSSTGLDGTLIWVQDFKSTVNGVTTHVIGQQWKLTLSNFEQATRNAKKYKDWSGGVEVTIAGGAVKDVEGTTTTGDPSGGNVNDLTPLTGEFVDYIKPDIEFINQSTDVDKGNKKYTMTFSITDKYYTSGILQKSDLTILMQNGQLDASGNPIIYNLQNELDEDSITLTPTAITADVNMVDATTGTIIPVRGHTIGHEYTLVIEDLEQLERRTGLKTADFSGIITVEIEPNKIFDRIGNANVRKVITSGINLVGGVLSGTELEVDVVDPIWERISSSALAKQSAQEVNANATTGTATIKIQGTDTYLDVADTTNSYDDSTLTSDEIEVYIDGKLDGDANENGILDEGETATITPTITKTATLTETRNIYDTDPVQTETVQYGVEYEIEINGWKQSAKQVKIKILRDAIKDESENGNKATEFIIYNCLELTNNEDLKAEGFLDGNASGTVGIERQNIEKVIFVSNLNDAPISVNEEGEVILGTNCWDVSAQDDKSILAWATQTETQAIKGIYTVYIGSDFEIFANQDSRFLFSFIGHSTSCENTSTIEGLNLLNTDSVIDMRYMFRYFGYRKMTSLELPDTFNTSNVTYMSNMFEACGYRAMITLDLGSAFDTKNVTTMSSMFMQCGHDKMNTLDLGEKFDTSKVEYMIKMFNECGYGSEIEDAGGNITYVGIEELDLGATGVTFNTAKVKEMDYMFADCGYYNMEQLKLGNYFDTQLVEDMQFMFQRCGYISMESLDLGNNFDTSAVKYMSYMFDACGYTEMTELDLGEKFNTSQVIGMQGMFRECGFTLLESFDLGNLFITYKVTDMSYMFLRTGNTLMTKLDLGPAFKKIASTNTDIVKDTGKSGACIIYAPESIYKSRTSFKLNSTDTTSTISYANGTINPIYKPEWQIEKDAEGKQKVYIDKTNKTLNVVIKGSVNSEVYTSDVTSTLTADDITVYIDGVEASSINKTVNINGKENVTLFGDVNFDGVVDTADVIFINQYNGGLREFTSEQFDCADVNLDGTVNNLDKEVIQKYLSGGFGVATLPLSSELPYKVTLSNFEEALRQTGKSFLEWSGNISIRIGGRGEDTSTYPKNVLLDTYGNQSMMETDELNGIWLDVKLQEEDSNGNGVLDSGEDINGNNALDVIEKDKITAIDESTTNITTTTPVYMFTDFIKPEYTYEYSTTNPDINTGTETVTVVFDVTDKHFESTALSTDTTGSLIKVIVAGNENANTPITKVLTRTKDVWYDVTEGINLVNPDATGTGRKVGERYQLVITGLDREDGFSYSGPLTLSFDAGTEDGSGNLTKGIRDKSGNLSEEKTITMGVNEPGGDADDEIIVDVVDPIWKVENINTNESNGTATLELIATDKYYENNIISGDDILVYIDGILDGDTDDDGIIEAGETPIISKILSTATALTPTGTGVKYTLTLSNWATDEYSGTTKIVIPAATTDASGNLTFGIIDESGNLSNKQEFILGHIDLVKPVIEEAEPTADIISQDAANKTETILINVLDKYINVDEDKDGNTKETIEPSELTVYIDGEVVPVDFTNSSSTGLNGSLTWVQDFTSTVNGDDSHIIGQQYKLVLSNFEQAPRNSKEYKDYSGTVTIKVAEGAVKDIVVTNVTTGDSAGGNSNDETTLTGDFVDYIKPDIEYIHDNDTSDIDTTNKKYVMTFDITDKYYKSGVLTTDDITAAEPKIEILMQNGQLDASGNPIIYNLKDEPVTIALLSTAITKTFNKTVEGVVVTGGTHTIGYKYTLTISNLEQLERKTGLKTVDYSGVITVAIDGNVIQDTTGNKNVTTTITSGVNFEAGVESGTVAEVDVVDPIWEKVESSALAKQPSDLVNATATTGTATIKVHGTDTYLDVTDSTNSYDDSTLTNDEIEVYIDGVKNESIIPDISSVTKLEETRRVYDFEDPTDTETVQYGVEYTISIDGWIQSAKQVKIKILEDAIKDKTGNGNKATEFIIYNCLVNTGDEMNETSQFLDKNESTTILRQNIEKVIFESSIDGATATGVEKSWNVSEINDGSIKAWYRTDEKRTVNDTTIYTVHIGSDHEIFANQDSRALFAYIASGENCTSSEETVTVIENINLLNTNSVTEMDYMFAGTGKTSMTELKLGDKFNTSNVRDMHSMFFNCGYSAMKTLDIGDNFDTRNVTDMQGMFAYTGCNNMTSLDLSSETSASNTTQFNTSSVTNMQDMFDCCGQEKMTTIKLGNNFDTSSVTNMQDMFRSCGAKSLTSLDLSAGRKDASGNEDSLFDTSNVLDMKNMFYNCGLKNMASLNLGNKFNTSKVTDMNSMFYYCGNEKLSELDLGDLFDTSNVTTMNSMFYRTGSLLMTRFDLGSKFNTNKVTDMYRMFYHCGENKLTSLDLGDLFYTTSVTNMEGMFLNCGTTKMEVLDLGPAFTKIATTNTDMFTACGTSSLVIYAPESIYSAITSFKINN